MSLLLLDTDFLIKVCNDPLPFLHLRELKEEYELYTLASVVAELHGLSKSKEGKTRRRALQTLRVLEEQQPSIARIQVIKDAKRGEADAALVEYAVTSSKEVCIATLDHSLLQILSRRGLAFLTLRNNRPLFQKKRGPFGEQAI